jgi:hypothetical protein
VNLRFDVHPQQGAARGGETAYRFIVLDQDGQTREGTRIVSRSHECVDGASVGSGSIATDPDDRSQVARRLDPVEGFVDKFRRRDVSRPNGGRERRERSTVGVQTHWSYLAR